MRGSPTNCRGGDFLQRPYVSGGEKIDWKDGVWPIFCILKYNLSR